MAARKNPGAVEPARGALELVQAVALLNNPTYTTSNCTFQRLGGITAKITTRLTSKRGST